MYLKYKNIKVSYEIFGTGKPIVFLHGFLETKEMWIPIIDSLKAQQTNGGAIALVAIEDEFVIIARSLGDQMQMMISDVTYALDYEVAAELIEVLDLEFPEEEDEDE